MRYYSIAYVLKDSGICGLFEVCMCVGLMVVVNDARRSVTRPVGHLVVGRLNVILL